MRNLIAFFKRFRIFIYFALLQGIALSTYFTYLSYPRSQYLTTASAVSGQLLIYRNANVEVKPQTLAVGQTESTVRTVISAPNLKTLVLDYNFTKGAQGWKAYNVNVNGVSLLVNYKNSFTKKITESGIDGLIKAMADKNTQVKAKK